jgi:multidrug efflux pump subunit AcrB
MAHLTDAERIARVHNTARFFTEQRQISWVALLAVIVWGVYGYLHMPRRKDPELPVRVAVALCPWPGVVAEEIEQLVTRPIERTIAENTNIHPSTAADFGIKSTTLPGLAIVTVTLSEEINDTKNEFNDINLKLNALNDDLPQGAGPIQFLSDFGDTAALTLTVASPRIDGVEIAVRARAIRGAIEASRARNRDSTEKRVASVYGFPTSIPPVAVRPAFETFVRYAESLGAIRDTRLIEGPGFIGMDGVSDLSEDELHELGERYIRERLQPSEIHPDFWGALVVRDLAETENRLAGVAGDKYSYAELDDFTDLIARTLQSVPEVSKVSRSGVLPEQVILEYSQERLASYGVNPANLSRTLSARNATLSGGVLEAEGKSLTIDPTGEFQDEKEIGDVLIPSSSQKPIYLRDLALIGRGYQSPARYLNFYTYRDADGRWRRSRAVTLAVQMRSGEQIERFGEQVDERLASVRQLLPEDLVLARTSDQPRQVRENIDLFMDALYEAIVLVVVVSLVGFWEWRSAVLMATSIPITLAMSFGMMHLLGLDLQQVSIASLIIALGLLVDDPVVAGDAIKRDLAIGHPPVVASWLGPTKLATAILYATVTNIVAYLPFLMLTGTNGDFLYSLPIVMTCALVSSRLVSMTFIPLLGYYLLRPKHELPVEERRGKGFAGVYYKIGLWSIRHRWGVAVASLAILALGGFFGSRLKSSFFPNDLQYLSYLDVWLPNDATLTSSNDVARQAEAIVQQVTAEFGKQHPGPDGAPRQVLHSMTTFVGGGGPRFWMSVSPELQQMNYAQVIIEVEDKEDTPELVGVLQSAISSSVPGARIDVQELQFNPVKPIEIFLSGRADVSPSQLQEQTLTLRALAGEATKIFSAIPGTTRVYDDWGSETFVVRLEVDPDRANISGITNQDVAASSATAISGYQVATLREGEKQIPVVARLRMEERTRLADVQNLYVYSSDGSQKVPLRSVSSIRYGNQTQRVQRRDHFRTISVIAFPADGVLASEVLSAAMPQLTEFAQRLPPGYTMEIGGEKAKQDQGFGELSVVMGISVVAIFLALVMQFKNAIKPFLVFAAIPYGVVGALGALWVMNAPFGFMGFLGIASLVGVIVSHVIVLFDFIEEKHEEGERLEHALLDAGIMRLRPVLITVGATVIALIPLALHGGPLWQPLCYAQIGGLVAATFITLLLVPVFYAIFVLDLKIVKWHHAQES